MNRKFKTAIITTLATVFVALSTPAHAITNGSMYKNCKKFADRSFEYSEPTDAMCLSYFAAIRDSGATICVGWKLVADNTNELDAKIQISEFRRMEGVGDQADLNAAIQHYVNAMQEDPERWKWRADMGVLESLQAIAPCE